MHTEAFQVQVELDIQAISCPGVWLCPAGKITLQLYMLDSCIQTVAAEPVFPVLCHEKFIFYKTFEQARRLSELQKFLNKETLSAELIQWRSSELGTVLATFHSNLSELLYPSTHEGSVAGVDIDLLMEPSKHFPGVIAPKIEVCTKTIIEDTVLYEKGGGSGVVNPKVISSKGKGTREASMRQRRVCHSPGHKRLHQRYFTKPRKSGKPTFTYRKPEDDLIARKPQGLGPARTKACDCRGARERSESEIRSICYKQPKECQCKSSPKMKPRLISKVVNCLCNNGHDLENCPVCSKYNYYFDKNPLPSTRVSPCQTICDKKKCHCHETTQSQAKKCVCEEISNSGNAKVVRCTCAQGISGSEDQSEQRLCLCSPKMKQSWAQKLHQRLTQTLDACNQDDRPYETYQYGNYRNDPESRGPSPVNEANCSDIECECPDTNIGEFYRNFYKRARSKVRCNQYVTPCCI